MTTLERAKRLGSTEGVVCSDDHNPTLLATDFFFGANAPQDTQDIQDSHDAQETHRSSEKPKRVQSPTPEFFDEYGYPNEGIDSAKLLNLPLSDYVRYVQQFHSRLNEGREYDDKYLTPLFQFARFCKAHPRITNLSDWQAMQAVEEVMHGWSDLPESIDPWTYYFPEADDADAAMVDFMNSWNAVRHIPFHSLLDNAVRLANDKPLEPPHSRVKLYKRFVSIAGWLQFLRGTEAILLPTRTLDRILGCNHVTVSRLRKLAVRDGLLTTTKPHNFRPGGGGEATEFRFAVERFKILTGDA